MRIAFKSHWLVTLSAQRRRLSLFFLRFVPFVPAIRHGAGSWIDALIIPLCLLDAYFALEKNKK